MHVRFLVLPMCLAFARISQRVKRVPSVRWFSTTRFVVTLVGCHGGGLYRRRLEGEDRSALMCAKLVCAIVIMQCCGRCICDITQCVINVYAAFWPTVPWTESKVAISLLYCAMDGCGGRVESSAPPPFCKTRNMGSKNKTFCAHAGDGETNNTGIHGCPGSVWFCLFPSSLGSCYMWRRHTPPISLHSFFFCARQPTATPSSRASALCRYKL